MNVYPRFYLYLTWNGYCQTSQIRSTIRRTNLKITTELYFVWHFNVTNSLTIVQSCTMHLDFKPAIQFPVEKAECFYVDSIY